MYRDHEQYTAPVVSQGHRQDAQRRARHNAHPAAHHNQNLARTRS